MKTLKKLLCVALAVVMVLCFAGCSTPKVAITVNGVEYETGKYLAYMMNTFDQAYYQGGLYYYAQQGVDIWSQTYPYGDDKLELDEYIKKTTVDAIVRQEAIKQMMKEAGVEPTEETTKSAQQYIDAADENVLLSYGVNMQHYKEMCMDFYRNELSLFLSRYDKNGTTPVKDDELRKFFDDNYLSYKIISVSMMNNDKEMSADEQKKVTDDLEKYLKLYKDGKDFNDVIAQYNYDKSTATDKKLEKLTDKDTRQDIDASQASDLKFVEALKKVGEGKAEVITYKANGTDLTAALVLRLDPEKGEGYETAFEDSRQSVLLGIKFEEFDKDVQAVADKITYEINSRAYKMCDPRNFVLA